MQQVQLRGKLSIVIRYLALLTPNDDECDLRFRPFLQPAACVHSTSQLHTLLRSFVVKFDSRM